MLDGQPQAEHTARAVGHSIEQVRKLAGLVDDLLDLSRVGQRGLTLQPEPVDLAELTRGIVRTFGEALDAAGCETTLEADQPIVGRWDPARLEQAIINLLSNAMKFGAGKPIHVRVRPEGERAVLSIRDRGIGIAPEDQVRIFERFERAASPSSTGGWGWASTCRGRSSAPTAVACGWRASPARAPRSPWSCRRTAPAEPAKPS
jgi:signal transduction histidine kinase